jgi:hypothetical protein
MRICPRCGALFLARFQLIELYESRTITLEPSTCHCTVDHHPDSPYSSGESLRDLTEPERLALREWLDA